MLNQIMNCSYFPEYAVDTWIPYMSRTSCNKPGVICQNQKCMKNQNILHIPNSERVVPPCEVSNKCQFSEGKVIDEKCLNHYIQEKII